MPKNYSNFSDTIEDQVIDYLKRSARTIMVVIDEDIDHLENKVPDAMAALNENLRVLQAINEVLLYFGDDGVWALSPEVSA